jgi:DNA-binding transcriptional LysR family regulator
MVLLDLPFSRDYFTSLFDGMQGAPIVAHSTRSSEMVRALVSAGFGFSILNIRPLGYGEGDAENTALRALPIRPAGAVPIFGIATTANVKQPKIVRAFIETCLNLKAQGAFDRMLVF